MNNLIEVNDFGLLGLHIRENGSIIHIIPIPDIRNVDGVGYDVQFTRLERVAETRNSGSAGGDATYLAIVDLERWQRLIVKITKLEIKGELCWCLCINDLARDMRHSQKTQRADLTMGQLKAICTSLKEAVGNYRLPRHMERGLANAY